MHSFSAGNTFLTRHVLSCHGIKGDDEVWTNRHAHVPPADRWAQHEWWRKAAQVAAGIRRRATTFGYSVAEREGADACAGYLTAKEPHLDYATALAQGWPIATGVIEGACRHLPVN